MKLLKFISLAYFAFALLTSCQKNGTKIIEVCHNGHTISIDANSWPAHLKHGDILGACSTILTTTICNQTWMIENLDVNTYGNGDPIPQVTNNLDWQRLTTGAWCYYNNDPANESIYGKLYNWYAINDPRGLAPAGWHIPSDAEWTTLASCLGGEDVAGGKMKETGTLLWLSPNTGATNSSGFKALPGGFRDPSGFNRLAGGCGWWSSTEATVPDPLSAWYRNIDYNGAYLGRTNSLKQVGFSVRCIKN